VTVTGGDARARAPVPAMRRRAAARLMFPPVSFALLGLGLQIEFDLFFPLYYFFFDLISNLTFFRLCFFRLEFECSAISNPVFIL
jgi:hypothetical protein